MPESTGVVLFCGLLVGFGVWAVIAGATPRAASLGDALAILDGRGDEGGAGLGHEPTMITDPSSKLEAVGALVYRRSPIPMASSTAARLALEGRSIGDFFAEKVVLGLLGLCAPLLVGVVAPFVGLGVPRVPLLIALPMGVLGFFVPDLRLRNTAESQRLDAQEALSTLFDLVTLERMANLSASQSIASATQVSEAPVFVAVRSTLERARLQQHRPWSDLRALANELDLPPLADMADVLQLDEQGATLADALRARVRELRSAHLMREKIAAQQVSERMTIWMTVPVLVFSLFFLAPPLLRMPGLA